MEVGCGGNGWFLFVYTSEMSIVVKGVFWPDWTMLRPVQLRAGRELDRLIARRRS